MISRIKSKDDKQHYAAMFELASVTQIMDDLKDYPYLICPDFVTLSSESISKRNLKVFLKDWLQKMIMNSQITQ